MSTLVYAALNNRRNRTGAAPPPPDVSRWVDAFAALVPAEVLAAHATLLSVTTSTVLDANKRAVTTITEPGTLTWIFYALIVLSAVLYLGSRLLNHTLQRLDLARMFVPPLAFVGWTMLQKTTAFDAAFPGVPEAVRVAIAVIGGMVLGLVAALLAYKPGTARTSPSGPATNPPVERR